MTTLGFIEVWSSDENRQPVRGEMGQRIRALDAVRRAAPISNSVELRREALAALALPFKFLQ